MIWSEQLFGSFRISAVLIEAEIGCRFWRTPWDSWLRQVLRILALLARELIGSWPFSKKIVLSVVHCNFCQIVIISLLKKIKRCLSISINVDRNVWLRVHAHHIFEIRFPIFLILTTIWDHISIHLWRWQLWPLVSF